MELPTVKAAIIDDEMHCIKTLRYLIERECKMVDIVFATTDSTAAKALIEEHTPELVFLDIEMPEINGIQLLSQFENIPFRVIFTTAYDQYAIKAIRLNALDYLLKPVNKQELVQSIDKYLQEKIKTTKEQITHLHLFTERKITDTIALSSAQGLYFVKLKDIIYLLGEDCYTHVILHDGTKHIISKTLANFDEILSDNALFFRVHKSYIINLSFIKQYVRGDGGEIIMLDNRHISLSRNKKEEFLKLFTKV